MKYSSLLKTAVIAAAMSLPFSAQANGVTIVLSEELDIVDPCEASRSNIGRVIAQNVSETITELVPGKGLQPRLAESWEDMGNGTWRFNLRKNVSFSDGSAFDAEDIAHSLKRIKSDKLTCEIGIKYFGGIEISTDIIDNHTIDITAEPAQPILPLLMSVVTVMRSSEPMDKYVVKPVGTGPYTFDQYIRGMQINLSANPNYWGGDSAVKKAKYIFRSDSAVRAAMVATGEADIAPNIALQDATKPESDFSYPNSETLYLRVDNEVAPTNDVRVRRALNHAIDREAFIGTILANGTIPATGMTPPSTIGYNHDLKPFAFDPSKAKELIAKAKADGVPVEKEIRLIGRINNFANVQETMEALQAMLQDVGFNVKLEMYEVAEWLDLYSKPYAEDRGPIIVEAMHDNANGDPVFSMFFKYASGGAQSGRNDAKLDKMIADATAATGSKREAMWKNTMAYIHDDAVIDVLLFHMVGFSRVNERLDFTPTIKTNSELQLSQIAMK